MRPALVLSFSMAFYYMFSDMYTPSTPMIAEAFHATSDEVQQTLTFFFVGSVISCLFSGWAGERFSNMSVIIYGALIAVLGAGLSCFANSIVMLNIARFLQGFGAVQTLSLGFVVLQNLYDPKKLVRLFSVLGGVMAIVPAVAPTVGGWVTEHLGWRMNFYILCALSLMNIVALLKGVPKDQPDPTPTPLNKIFHNYWKVLRHPGYLSYALIMPLFLNGEWFLLSFLPFYTQDVLGVSPETYGYAMALMILFYGMGSFIGGKYASFNKSPAQVIRLGQLINLGGALSLFALAFVPHSIWSISVAVGICILGAGFCFPVIPPTILGMFTRLQGTASALRYLLVVSFCFVGAFAAEVAGETNLQTAGLYLIGSICFSMIILFLRPKNT